MSPIDNVASHSLSLSGIFAISSDKQCENDWHRIMHKPKAIEF